MERTEWIDIAIEMARRWGVMETLEDIPSMHEIPTIGAEGSRETLLAWAKEYMDSKQTDMTLFLKKKLDQLLS
ncbi:MAG: hypothetical protein IJN54_16980 [Lachnospiraceae bacterium]|nr:hypothetical protein [Lachnospiraceae bacterium]